MWVLNCGENFPAGIFETKEKAEEFIEKYGLSGTLTKYPVNKIVYDWAIENEYFKPKSEWHKESGFIGTFSSAHQEHYHYDKIEDEK